VSSFTEAIAPADRRIRYVGEDVKPGPRIDVVELGAHDERRDERGSISTTI
jgi:hypothetical protein